MVAAPARLGQTAIAVELGRCGQLTALFDALVNNPVRVTPCRWQKPLGASDVFGSQRKVTSG
jgi:hypothetical protein